MAPTQYTVLEFAQKYIIVEEGKLPEDKLRLAHFCSDFSNGTYKSEIEIREKIAKLGKKFRIKFTDL